MILSFSSDVFKERILNKTKIHTIRTDRSERWKRGQTIHFWRGNPRNTKSETKPHQFFECSCSSVQDTSMELDYESDKLIIRVDNRTLADSEVEQLAFNDGFDNTKQMSDWFFPEPENENTFKGRLIHWTKCSY